MATKIPIQVFSKSELDIAYECARALWYGINFKNGKYKTSDAELLDAFATPFYNIPKNNSYTATSNDILKLFVACQLGSLFRMQNTMDFNAGLLTIHQKIYPIYQNYLQRTATDKVEMFGAECIQELSDGITTTITGKRLVLSSRMLFFIVPTMPIFNMNNHVARAYKLRIHPHLHKDDFCTLMLEGLDKNKALLSTYTLPKDLYGMNVETLGKVASSDWLQRRILDLAILIKLGLAIPNVGLSAIVQAEILKLQNRNNP